MGYCISMVNENFFIPKEKFNETLKAIKSLAGKETIKDSSGKHYSWVDTNDFLTARTIFEAFECWRWYVDVNNNGDVNKIEFQGEKMGDDDRLFTAIAPFVKSGSYIEMQGEDGALWRWSFKDEKFKTIKPTITWG